MTYSDLFYSQRDKGRNIEGVVDTYFTYFSLKTYVVGYSKVSVRRFF